MAGYVRKRTFKLVFADEEMGGLEVLARSASMERYLEISQLQDAIDADDEPDDEAYERVRALAAQVAGHLVRWNLEECEQVEEEEHECKEGCVMQPVPCTAKGLIRQDLEFFKEIVGAWMKAAVGVSGPKAQSSSGGPPSVEALLTMEPLSESQAS